MENEENLQEEHKPACKCHKCKTILLVVLIILTFASLVVGLLANYKISLVLNSLQAGGIQIVNNKPVQQQPVDFLISEKYDKGQSFEKSSKKNKPVIVFFYVDWCGYCKRFAPVFAKLMTNNKLNKDFAFAYVNCENEKNADLVAQYGVNAYPSVFVVDGQKNTRELVPNEVLFQSEDNLITKIISLKK